MLQHSDENALSLTIDEAVYTFCSTQDFEFALAGRTCLPPAKIAALIDQGDEALLKEAEGIRKVEKRFADALSGALADVTSISPFLKEMDLNLISQDQEWRAIITALNGQPRQFEEYKKIALIKYMQYLTARQEVVKTLYARRQLQGQIAAGQELAHSGDPAARETIIFDMTTIAGMEVKQEEFARIPKGETVEIEFEPEQAVDVLICKHRCRIVLRDKLTFVDDRGRDCRLRHGKNIIGRDVHCDISLDPEFRDVSRKHLILETDGAALVRLTDISSHGTSLPPEFLENTSA